MGLRRAVVLYATSDTHAVAVLVFAHLLRTAAEVVMLHTPVSRDLLALARETGIRTVAVEPVGRIRNWYYADCLVKLRALQLTEYESVLCADADAIPLRRLDALFETPNPGGVAAAPACWLGDGSATSALFLARPSAELWERAAARFPLGEYDGEVLNRAFPLGRLPDRSLVLNSEWERGASPGGDPWVVHFSAVGKPWSYAPRTVRRLRPDAHPAFHEMWERWWEAREEVFRGRGGLRNRLRRELGQWVRLQKALGVAAALARG